MGATEMQANGKSKSVRFVAIIHIDITLYARAHKDTAAVYAIWPTPPRTRRPYCQSKMHSISGIWRRARFGFSNNGPKFN